MRADDTIESFAKKIELATWIGAMQSTFTHFPYLRKGWVQTCQEDRLLGVDITGQCDNPALSQNEEAMSYFNQLAIRTAKIASETLGINMPAAITCGKPSGNTSQFVDCASGFHPRFSKFYFRHVRIASHDPLCKMVRDAGLPMFKENGEENLDDKDVKTWVARFPVKSPEGAMLREDETALEQCERYLQIMKTLVFREKDTTNLVPSTQRIMNGKQLVSGFMKTLTRSLVCLSYLMTEGNIVLLLMRRSMRLLMSPKSRKCRRSILDYCQSMKRKIEAKVQENWLVLGVFANCK